MKQDKYKYKTPILSVVILDKNDVITTSGEQGDREGQQDFFTFEDQM